MTRGNIIGEDLKPFLIDEIKNRQKVHGSGYITDRTENQISYLSNRNAWIKMGSSVIVEDPTVLTNEEFRNNVPKNMELSKKNGYLGVIHNLTTDKGEPDKSTFRLYHEGGIDSDAINLYGHVPPPGIESFEVKTRNRGSIRTGTLKMKAFSKSQFDVIDFLFFRPGYSIMVEWGWNSQFEEGKIKDFKRDTILDDFWWDDSSKGSTQLEMMARINSLREKSNGNYDGFFGKISNFEWTLGANGIYDITLSLVTMGDVIESLNLNIAPQYAIIKKSNENLLPIDSTDGLTTTTEGEVVDEKKAFRVIGDGRFLADANIVKGAESNQFCNILYQTIGEKWYLVEYEYYSLEDSIDIGYINQAIDDRYNYYMTFSELIWNVSEYLIPLIVNNVNNPTKSEKLISFDDNIKIDGKLYIPIFPNQIALDPTVCLFEHKDNIGFNGITNKTNNNGESESKGVLNYIPLGLNILSDKGVNKNKPFVEEILSDNEKVRVGNLNNLFINYDFISKCLLEGTNEKGEINLFSFLKKICDGINKALGNVNQIEPVIKDDKIITFIDKQPIPGTKEFRKAQGINDVEDYNIELYGYNTEGKEITSNFVKDFTFKTKITPQMSSQISIGATANGSNTSTINGTIFENWNKGLKDKFNLYSVNPSPFSAQPPSENKELRDSIKMLNLFKTMDDVEIEGASYSVRKTRGDINSKTVEIGGKLYNRDEEINKYQVEIFKTVNQINESFIVNDYGYYLIEAFNGEQYVNVVDNLKKYGIDESLIPQTIKEAAEGREVEGLKKILNHFKEIDSDFNSDGTIIYTKETIDLWYYFAQQAQAAENELKKRGVPNDIVNISTRTFAKPIHTSSTNSKNDDRIQSIYKPIKDKLENKQSRL